MEQSITRDEIKSRLKKLIANDLDMNISIDDIPDDVSLQEDGIGLDSISIVNLIVLIENRFGFSFGETEITPALFGSVNSLVDFIVAKMPAVAVEQ